MRKVGKIISFTPFEEVKDKDGNAITSKKDGLVVMKRQVVVDCSYVTEYGDEVREGYVCDMYNDVGDDYLEKLKTSGVKVSCYISANYAQGTDNFYQRITLNKINSTNS